MSWDRRGEARAALRTVVSDPDYGVTALSSPQAMSGLLKDLLPDLPREAGVLVAAAEAHLSGMLHDHWAQGMDSDTACALAAQDFAARTAFTPEASWRQRSASTQAARARRVPWLVACRPHGPDRLRQPPLRELHRLGPSCPVTGSRRRQPLARRPTSGATG